MARAIVTSAELLSGTVLRFGVTFYGTGVPGGSDLDFADVDVSGLATAAAVNAAIGAEITARATTLGYTLTPPGIAVIGPTYSAL